MGTSPSPAKGTGNGPKDPPEEGRGSPDEDDDPPCRDGFARGPSLRRRRVAVAEKGTGGDEPGASGKGGRGWETEGGEVSILLWVGGMPFGGATDCGHVSVCVWCIMTVRSVRFWRGARTLGYWTQAR